MARNRAETLRKRASRCVCKQCGKPLEVRNVVYNKYGGSGEELCCLNCKCIEWGTEPEIYSAAKALVEQVQFNYYPDLMEDERRHDLNVAKVCEILSWTSKYWHILSKDGFTVPLDLPDIEDF